MAMDKHHEAEEVRKNMTIPQLISFLKTAFLKRHFDEVQNILVHRHTQLNIKVQELVEDNQLLSEKLAVEELQVASLEDKVSKEHQKRNVVEGERDALESELRLWKMRFRELSGKTKGETEREPAAGEVKQEEEEVVWEEDNDEAVPIVIAGENFDSSRITQLELNKLNAEEAEENNEAVPVRDGEDQTQPAPAAGEIKHEEVIWEDNYEDLPVAARPTIFGSSTITRLELSKVNAEAEVNNEAVPAGDGESDHKGSALGSSPNPSDQKISDVDLIVIDESDDDCDFVGVLSGDRRSSEGCQKGQRLELLNDVKGALALKRKREPCISSSTEDTSSSSDSDSDSEKSSYINRPWKSEIEMFFAFQKNNELVMKAVCALYKQHTFSKKSVGMTRGFKDAYVHRGRALGAFLTDGDCEGKLSKSLWELCSYDPNALDECKEIAFEHYSELFEIHKKNEVNMLAPRQEDCTGVVTVR